MGKNSDPNSKDVNRDLQIGDTLHKTNSMEDTLNRPLGIILVIFSADEVFGVYNHRNETHRYLGSMKAFSGSVS